MKGDTSFLTSPRSHVNCVKNIIYDVLCEERLLFQTYQLYIIGNMD